ncbi:CdaR family transcriptional regulator [Psychromonas sp. psych-6C06]|uniref:sugar diacid recognition domain-containing protein n=1 Tax=Psychromonas sp. psych-6C06 TaxID=2058089 RepID=UPI000C337BCE|nr:sugar diacid recognition domain-containing protein [Psychromonas sp. psych-6C06]PKF61294.1 CdaR family transcriptional regulator [Psychromonas sp. psych-6C06]
MFLLDSQLAQQIADRTMEIIGNNINVMNQSGVIIGSGDKSRLSKTHDGALLALQRGETVEVTQSNSQSLKGVKPGINLILKISDKIIGVIGITGDPDEIRNYAKLVKMTAEMIVEQATLTERLQWDRRHREEFISSWISGEIQQSELLDWGKRLDIDTTAPRVAVIIRFRASEQPMSLRDIRRVVELLERPYRDNLVAVLSMNEILVLKPATFYQGEWNSHEESKRIDQLLIRLKQYDIIDIDIALGHYFIGEQAIPLSFQSAQLTLQAGLNSNNNKHLYDELRLPVLLSPLQNSWQAEQLCKAFKRLQCEDKNGQLVKTLKALFLYQHSLTECAESLFIHRNTLRYRIKKIKEITKLDPENLAGLLELYIGYQLKKTG